MNVDDVVHGGARLERSGAVSVLRLSGAIDETFDRATFLGLGRFTVVDLDAVRSVTSLGVKEWLAAMREIPAATFVCFVNARPSVAMQFNLVVGFAGHGALVSLYAPFACPATGEEHHVLLDLRRDHADLVARRLQRPECHPGEEAEFDDLFDTYFAYVLSRPPPQVPALVARLLDGALEPPEGPVKDGFVREGVSAGKAELRSPSGRAAPRSLILLEPDPAQARRIERVLRATRYQVDVHPSVSSIPADAPCDLLVVDHRTLDASTRGALSERFPPALCRRLVTCSGRLGRAELAELLTVHGLTNLLADGDVEDEHLLVTVQKILRRDVFGLEKYFPWGTEGASFTLRSSLERASGLRTVEEFTDRLRVVPRLRESILTVAEELFTNALYDAPVDAAGRFLHAGTSRRVPVELEGEPVQVELMTDGRRVGISVRDPFGSLTAAQVLAYLTKCLRAGADQVDDKPGGAGLGLYYVLESLSHLAINLKPGRATEVLGLIDVRGTYKDFAARGKSFNVFVDDESAG
jgi:hypothetical protein